MKVEYIDHMGNDLAVVNAARVSFDKEAEWEPVEWDEDEHGAYLKKTLADKDKNLIHYLADHNHWTPFAHTTIKLRMEAPVPIRTQCFKHKSGFVENEESRRYISSTPSCYLPTSFRKVPDGSMKQGSGEDLEYQSSWYNFFSRHYKACLSDYQFAIEKGMCPEQARFLLPQGTQVKWIWTGNVASFARFCKQRLDSHAQVEIQQLAQEVSDIIGDLFPESWKALTK
jgi:thymidylate synthase (FAD)